jgi:hypothetical protein
MLQKVIWTIVILLILVWIFADPAAHGADLNHWVTDLFTFGSNAANG